MALKPVSYKLRLWALVLVTVVGTLSTGAGADTSPLSGLWRLAREDGGREYLDIYGERRYTWRDNRGNTSAGDVSVDGEKLTLRSRWMQRILRFQLGDGWLRLENYDADSIEEDSRGMSPLGATSVVYYAPDRFPGPWPVRVAGLADLSAVWRVEPEPGRADVLTLMRDGRFVYAGAGGRHAEGDAAYANGVLNLKTPKVERRLAVQLSVAKDGWQLELIRLAGDRAAPADDSAELPPCFGDRTTWRRALDPLSDAELAGSYRYGDATGLEHRLTLKDDGSATYGRGSSFQRLGGYTCDGVHLTLNLKLESPAARQQAAAHRTFYAQKVAGSLLLWCDPGDVRWSERGSNCPPYADGLVRFDGVSATP